MPPRATTYAVPARWREEWGVRRYGFHGLRSSGSRSRSRCRGWSSATSAAARSCCGARRWLGRHDDGLQPPRGRADGDALGLRRSRSAAVSAAAAQALAGRARSLARARVRAAGARRLDRPPRARRDARARRLRLPHVATAVGAMAVALGGLDALAFTGGVGEGSEWCGTASAHSSRSWARSPCTSSRHAKARTRARRPTTPPRLSPAGAPAAALSVEERAELDAEARRRSQRRARRRGARCPRRGRPDATWCARPSARPRARACQPWTRARPGSRRSARRFARRVFGGRCGDEVESRDQSQAVSGLGPPREDDHCVDRVRGEQAGDLLHGSLGRACDDAGMHRA